MTFVARTRQLGLLQRFLADPTGGMLSVTGPTGSGKSFLLAALRESIPHPTTIVRAGTAPVDWPLGGLSSILAALDGLLGTTTLRLLDAHAPDDLPSLARDIASAIEDRSAADFVLLIDDAELLDAPSRTVLDVVTLRCAPRGMRCVLAIRTPTQDTTVGRRQSVDLPDLEVDTMVRLAREFVPDGADPAVLLLFAAASGGNPLALEGLLSSALPEDLDGTEPLQVPLPADPRLERAHREVVAALDEEQMALVEVLSSAPATPESVLLASDDLGTTAVALDELLGSGLVGRTGRLVRLRSLVLRSTVYWNQSAQARRTLHEKLAATPAEDFPEWTQWHLSFVDPARAEPISLLRGARRLVETGDLRPALHHIERALSLTSDADVDVSRSLCELVESLLAQGEIEIAERYLSFARTFSATSGEAPAPLVRVALFVSHVRGEALPIHLLRHSIGVDEEDGERIDLLALGALLLLQRWEVADAQELADLAHATSGRTTPLLTSVRSLTALYRRVLHGEEVHSSMCDRDAIACLTRRGDEDMVRTVLAQALSIAESYAEARAVVDPSGLGGSSHTLVRPLSRALDLTEIELRAGLPARAREAFRGLAPLSLSTRAMLPLVLRAHAVLLLSEGRTDEADAILSEIRRQIAPGANPRLEAEVTVLMAGSARIQGNLESAVQHYARARALSTRFRAPHLLRVHEHHIQTLVELGRREEAAAVLDELTELSHDFPSPWARLAIANSRALLSIGEVTDDGIRDLLETTSDTVHELQRGQFLLAYSQRLDALGRGTDSRSARDAGLMVLDQTGQHTVRFPAAPSHGSVDSSNPLMQLGEKEQAVAELVGRGMRNKSIAAELFVSVRTVELRLTRIYRTLGIRSRAQLVQILQKAEASDAPRADAGKGTDAH